MISMGSWMVMEVPSMVYSVWMVWSMNSCGSKIDDYEAVRYSLGARLTTT